MKGLSGIPLIARAVGHQQREAIIATEGTFTYQDLLRSSAKAASSLLDGADDLGDERVAFLAPPGFDHVATQWGIWRAGGIATPLSVSDTARELEYKVKDSGAAILVAHPEFEARLRPIATAYNLRFTLTPKLLDATGAVLPKVDATRRAMIVYTSGTTSNPKGVVTTHANIQAQVTSLVSAWEWTPEDHILNALPFHHVHGIINALSCALWVGARCEILPRFDVGRVWARLASGDLTLYMAVPTAYKALLAVWDQEPPARQKEMSDGCARLRLMVSGSDALPVDTFEKWKAATGHVLLERYGMTEIGMALSNPLHGERVPGHVGTPLPGVDRGPGVFQEYWRKPQATRDAFTDNGWFCTGDIASVENGSYRIWGRASQDMLISGGENVSAIEVQRELLTHPHIEECAVVGVNDPYWGEAVSAALVMRDGRTITRESLREWARGRLAPYKIPQRVLVCDALPRNAMGKVIKPELVRLFGRQRCNHRRSRNVSG